MQINNAMCGCNKNYKASTIAPTIQNGTNQILLKQIADQQRQQQEVQRIIQQSVNPTKTLIKTYR